MSSLSEMAAVEYRATAAAAGRRRQTIEWSYLADFSLALINRTGAYYICGDILRGMPHLFSHVRYWQFILKEEPRGFIRKLLGLAMLWELNDLVSTSLFRVLPAAQKQRTLLLDLSAVTYETDLAN
jgi:hypothetical protein